MKHRLFACVLLLAPICFASEPPPLPAPGRLVDVGGWSLHLNCSGKVSAAQPTVILEAGTGDFSVEWSLVQPRVATFARVCSYDRAGDGWSELGPHPRTMHQVAYELHTLLGNAGERPPYVLVGHSYGGWLVRVYRSMYPADVAGLVLIDGGADNPWRKMPDGKLVRSQDLVAAKKVPAVKTDHPLRIEEIPPQALDAMKAGLPEAVAHANDPPRNKLPLDAQRMRTWALGRPEHVAAAVNPFVEEELRDLHAEHANGEIALGDLPLAVITRGRTEDAGDDLEGLRRKEYVALAALSRHGAHVVAARSGHHVQIEEPELVATTIRQIVGAARAADKIAR